MKLKVDIDEITAKPPEVWPTLFAVRCFYFRHHWTCWWWAECKKGGKMISHKYQYGLMFPDKGRNYIEPQFRWVVFKIRIAFQRLQTGNLHLRCLVWYTWTSSVAPHRTHPAGSFLETWTAESLDVQPCFSLDFQLFWGSEDEVKCNHLHSSWFSGHNVAYNRSDFTC